MAIYDWAKNNDRVTKKSFHQPDMEERPPQGTMEPDPAGVLPTIADPLDMLPTPEDLIAALATLCGLDDPTEADLKAACRRQADTL